MSDQLTGIVLHWEGYDGQEATGNDSFYQFVPKTHVQGFPGRGVNSGVMTSSQGGIAAFKYVYVYDDRITGKDQNSKDAYVSGSGIEMTPRNWVITEVIGL